MIRQTCQTNFLYTDMCVLLDTHFLVEFVEDGIVEVLTKNEVKKPKGKALEDLQEGDQITAVWRGDNEYYMAKIISVSSMLFSLSI